MGLMDLFKKKSSGDVAKDRLKLLLVTDRASCSPEMMEQIKNEIIQVISKHMDIDMEGLDIQITQTESDSNKERYRHCLLIFRSAISDMEIIKFYKR